MAEPEQQPQSLHLHEHGYDVDTEAGYNEFKQNCLTCHGGYSGEKDDKSFARDEPQGDQPGISCSYCHQEGAKVDWIGAHSLPNSTAWRMKPPVEKTAAGMRDLVNVATQSATCFDCHIGNRDKKMFVTHQMYAAGHPPLPGIEVQTFCSSMPQHWIPETELTESLKAFPEKDAYFALNYPGLFGAAAAAPVSPEKTFWKTRKMLIGALVAQQHYNQLLIDSSKDDRWGDFSLYDCAACHHELSEPSVRQQRPSITAPGDLEVLNGPKHC